MLNVDSTRITARACPISANVDWWAEAERSLEDLETLLRREPELEVNRGTVAVLRAQVDARFGNANEALARLEAVRPSMTSRADRMELAVALGGVFATREAPEAIDHLSEAIRLAEDDPDIPPRQLLELRQLLAAHCTLHDRYDADAVARFWTILRDTDRVLASFRSGFVGKASPVHLFWHGFDLAHSRFSGRRAPARRDPGVR